MNDYARTFFEGKRPWSKIKDAILGAYMRPYLTKLRATGAEIILIDGFAGAGTFGDGNTDGSPLIIENLANEIVPQQHRSFFINKSLEHHNNLQTNLERRNYKQATAICGEAEDMISQIIDGLTNQALFVYLDPFGLSGYSFELVRNVLKRIASTEMVIILHAPALHRLAARHRVAQDDIDDQVRHNHSILTKTLGGTYWQDILWDETLQPTERAERVVQKYCNILESSTKRITGFCPIQRERGEGAKYYIIFVTGHRDGLKIMNDTMIVQFEKHMTDQEFQGTLFADTDWKSWRGTDELDDILFELVTTHPNLARHQYFYILLRKHFFRFTESEFIQSIKRLVSKELIRFTSTTNRLNDNAILSPSLN